MAEANYDAKNRGEFVVIEAKPFAITPKVPNSFSEGFYEAEQYYKNVVEWVTTKLAEVSKARRIFVYSLEEKREHLMFWIHLAEASNNEILGQLAPQRERFKHFNALRPQLRTQLFHVKFDNEGAYQIFHFISHTSNADRNTHVHYEVRVAMPEKVLAKREISCLEVKPKLAAALLSRFNAPELMKRRLTSIAKANASHTKESDDALEHILMEFEKLSF